MLPSPHSHPRPTELFPYYWYFTESLVSPQLMVKILSLEMDKDSLLDQTLVSLLNFLLGPSVWFLIKSSLSRTLLSQSNQNPHSQCLTTLDILPASSTPTIPQGRSDHPGLSSGRILLGQFTQNLL